jgi:arylsulfatase/uncharacterized sulfatase
MHARGLKAEAMKRLPSLSTLLAALATLTVAGAAQAAGQPRPNIVVLVADDWGFSDVGAFGGEIATPNLDELARRGVRFSNFHVAASCSPTRSMLLTGVDNHRNGHGNLRETMPGDHLGRPGYLGSLVPNVVTVASLLQAGGYRTVIAGKWNVGNEPENLPNRRGFDRSFIMGDTGSDNWEPEKRYLPHAAKVHWFEDGHEPVMPKEYYSSTFFVDKTIEYLRGGQGSGKPFFAYVGFQANHVPVQAPASFIAKYKGRYDGGWTALREARRRKAVELGLVPADAPMVSMATTADWNALSASERQYQARLMEVYAAMADALDFEVGRLIAHLKSTGEFENTVFVFLSDNGPEGSDYKEADLWLRFNYSRDFDRLGGQGAYVVPGPSWASASASPLATFKFYAGEGGIRSPLIISGPAVAAPNQVHTGLAHVTDILPTLLDLAQLPPPGGTWQGQAVLPPTGRSLLPALSNPAQSTRAPDEVLGYELAGNKALFKGDLKLVLNIPPIGDGRWHLYDLRKDPGETQDLQAQQPQAFAALQADYERWAQAQGVLPLPADYNPVRQVLINSFVNYWIPTYKNTALAVLVSLAAAVAGFVFWRRRRA